MDHKALLLGTVSFVCFGILVEGQDEISPTIICPSSTVTRARYQDYTTATVSFATTCEDNVDGDITPTCNATSDVTQFPVGETIVTCLCTDQADNTNQCSFGVTVTDDTRPTITCPRNIVAVARNQGHTTATVDFVATCEDNVDRNISPTCTEISGVTQFSVRETTVSCSCRDQAGNTNQCSFIVTVTDDTPPDITCPSTIIAVARNEGYTTATVDFVAICEDNVDGNIIPTCTERSGFTQFVVGDRTVRCSCRDQAGNTNQCSFIVTVTDDTPPDIRCPRTTVAQARNQRHTTATVDFVATCEDNVDGNIIPTCTEISAVTQFLVGDTTVSCSCTDQAGNTNQCSFIVEVTDILPPHITCPRNKVAVAQNQGNATATIDFAAACEDNVDGNISPTCNATSDITQFPVGQTIVTCSCTDQSDNTNQCSFRVDVIGFGAQGACPSDYSFFDASCYKFHEEVASFARARTVCQSEGGDLTSVTNEQENNYVGDLANGKRSWIGGERSKPDAVTNIFRWLSGEPWSFKSWRKREPNNWGGREHCIETNFVRRAWWNDHFCHREKPFVCEIPVF